MVYTLGDFIANLRRECPNPSDVNMQSDEALEHINACLPRNMMVKKLFLEERAGKSILDVKLGSG